MIIPNRTPGSGVLATGLCTVRWSETSLERLRPDALARDQLPEREALFWLEGESGNASRETLWRRTALHFPLSLVFALLAPPWVRQAVGDFYASADAGVEVTRAV